LIDPITRKVFVRRMGGAAIALLLAPRVLRGASKPPAHPDPRPGITSADVLPDSKLPKQNVRQAYAAARAHPEIFDGLRCACGCDSKHRSLLVCYETMQPTGCHGCVEQAELVSKAIADNKNLAEIREMLDKKYG